MPKLPRGIGVPPFFSNLEILSRKLAALTPGLVFPLGLVGVTVRLGESDAPGEVAGGLAGPLRWFSAAIRSFRLTGGVVALDEALCIGM